MADRHPVREPAGSPLRAFADADVRHALGIDRREGREVRALLLSRREPDQIRAADDGVEQHQPLDGPAEGGR